MAAFEGVRVTRKGHLRLPEGVRRRWGFQDGDVVDCRNRSGHLHEPLMLLAYLAAITEHIDLVPSIIVAPSVRGP